MESFSQKFYEIRKSVVIDQTKGILLKYFTLLCDFFSSSDLDVRLTRILSIQSVSHQSFEVNQQVRNNSHCIVIISLGQSYIEFRSILRWIEDLILSSITSINLGWVSMMRGSFGTQSTRSLKIMNLGTECKWNCIEIHTRERCCDCLH